MARTRRGPPLAGTAAEWTTATHTRPRESNNRWRLTRPDFFPASYPRVPAVPAALTDGLSIDPADGSGALPAARRTWAWTASRTRGPGPFRRQRWT